MLYSLTAFLTALTATSGEDTHYSEWKGHVLKGGCVLLYFRSIWQ